MKLGNKGVKMDSYKFQKACKEWLIKVCYEKFNVELEIEDIEVVWSSEVLEHNKIVLSTKALDGVYYVECTQNSYTQETYFDIYKKRASFMLGNEILMD